MDNFVALFAVSQCLLITGLVVRPSAYRWMLWPSIACINCYCYFRTAKSDVPIDEGLRRCAVVLYTFVASDYILLTDVQHELHMVGEEEPISSLGLWSRLKWGLQLFFGPRGVGWTHQPRSILPPYPYATRTQFIASQLGWLAVYVLAYDATSILMRADPFFVKHAPSFSQQPLVWRLWGVMLFALSSTLSVSIVHTICSIVSIASRLSEPEMWPPIFGKWIDAYTVRRFWT
jgi:hypothetical protein